MLPPSPSPGPDGRVRCAWAGTDPLMVAYHDTEWGAVERDPVRLWGKLVLDGFQAGLAWIIVLRKRDAFLRAFDGFDPERVARFDERRVAALLADPGIIRSRSKIEAAVGNARAYLAMREAGQDFSDAVWSLAGPRRVLCGDTPPASTPESEAMSKFLRARSFRFVGPVIVYAWMQAVGLVNDHAKTCFRAACPKSEPPRGADFGQ